MTRRGPPEAAKRHWSLASQLHPDFAEAHFNQAMSSMSFFQDYEGAAEGLLRALRVGNERIRQSTPTNLAQVYLAQRRRGSRL